MATQNGAFVFSASATSPNLTNISPLFARTVPSDGTQGQALAQYAVEKGWKKIAILQETAEYPLSITNAFADEYTSDKGIIIKEEYATLNSDFRTLLLKLRDQNPDAILFIPASPATATKMINDFKNMSWDIQILGNEMFSGNSEIVVANKDLFEGAVVAEQRVGPDTPEYIIFRDAYKARFGEDLLYESYAQAERDLLYILRDGLKKYGEDPEKLAAWVRTVKDYQGFSGGITIDSNGDRIGGHVVKIIKNGRTEAIGN